MMSTNHSFSLIVIIVSICAVILLICFIHTYSHQGPRISLEASEYDMGEVDHDKIKTIMIKFKNSGTDTLHIEKVITGCNCIETILGEQEYAPGEAGSIRIDYHATGSPGYNIRHAVHIYSDDKKARFKKVILKGHIMPSIAIVPHKINFGNITIGSSPEHSVIVASLGLKGNFQIESVSTNIKQADILISEANHLDVPRKVMDKGNSYRITLRLPEILNMGELKGYLQISTNSEKSKSLLVPVTGNVVSSFLFKPKHLFFPIKNHSPKRTQILTIVALHPVELSLKNLDQCIKCLTKTIAPSETWIFECVPMDNLTCNKTGTLKFDIKGRSYEKTLSIPYSILDVDPVTKDSHEEGFLKKF